MMFEFQRVSDLSDVIGICRYIFRDEDYKMTIDLSEEDHRILYPVIAVYIGSHPDIGFDIALLSDMKSELRMVPVVSGDQMQVLIAYLHQVPERLLLMQNRVHRVLDGDRFEKS